VKQLVPGEVVDVQYRALGAVRIKSPARSKTAACENVRVALTAVAIPVDEIRNSRREIMFSFHRYDNPPALALSIKSPGRLRAGIGNLEFCCRRIPAPDS
jgi:hypothetical protein